MKAAKQKDGVVIALTQAEADALDRILDSFTDAVLQAATRNGAYRREVKLAEALRLKLAQLLPDESGLPTIGPGGRRP